MTLKQGAKHMPAAFLAIDWGTTNRRVYRFDDLGRLDASVRDDRGILAIPAGGFAAEIAEIRERFGDLPVLCAGMVGSNRGWVETPYVPTTAGIDDVARAVHWIEPRRTAIVPGLVHASGARRDVMRGEEVQILGAALAGLTPTTGLLCQPGTHCKWAWIDSGRIDRFVTAITGELFSLIRTHSLLAPQLHGEIAADASFLEGVADAREDDVAARLFAVRADAVSGAHRIAHPASYVSGLLIGSDVHRRVAAGDHIFLLADPVLGALYEAAITAFGATSSRIDSNKAFAAGILRIWSEAA